MIDHIGIAVTDIRRSRGFYEKALAPLGYTVMADQKNDSGNSVVMFGAGEIDFAIADGERVAEENHIAFRAKDRATVRAFHAAALAAGGRDNGAPGLRPRYHSNYYAAFAYDPDGFNIEAVCHAPE